MGDLTLPRVEFETKDGLRAAVNDAGVFFSRSKELAAKLANDYLHHPLIVTYYPLPTWRAHDLAALIVEQQGGRVVTKRPDFIWPKPPPGAVM